jgi:tetraacyldisaccharide 4'-kinase
MKIFKPKFWHKKNSLISLFFLPFSIFFQFLITVKKIFKKEKKFSIPVICVGNIYLGGTGKTPLCIELAKMLEILNIKTAIVKKFYKAHEDEFDLIESKKIKLFKNISRSESIKNAEKQQFDCVILDDGFQDTSIYKNLNIVCFSGDQLIGNGMTIPAGPLREPLSSLKKCQIVLINGNFNEFFEKKIKKISNNISIYYSKYMPVNLTQFKEQRLLAFAGIGNPNNFFNLLEKNNLQIFKKIPFPDHYGYSINELNDLVEYSIKNQLKIITTEKDYSRIKRYNIPEIQFLKIELEIKNKDKLEKEVKKCLF